MYLIYVSSFSQNIKPTQSWNAFCEKDNGDNWPLIHACDLSILYFCNLRDCCCRHLFWVPQKLLWSEKGIRVDSMGHYNVQCFFFFELTNILLICTSSGQELCRLLYCALYIFPSSTQMPDRLICFGLCSAMVAFSCIILHQNYTHCFYKVKRFC